MVGGSHSSRKQKSKASEQLDRHSTSRPKDSSRYKASSSSNSSRSSKPTKSHSDKKGRSGSRSQLDDDEGLEEHEHDPFYPNPATIPEEEEPDTSEHIAHPLACHDSDRK